MSTQTHPDVSTYIIKKAKSVGVSLAGIVSVDSLENSPSHTMYGQVEWPTEAKSVLVLALAHKATEPELDWWGEQGGTAGNRRLQDISKILRQFLHEEFNIEAQLLPYQVGPQGIFLKDAAALAGLGTIGANNLLLTPEFGPRVRLRALSLDVELTPTRPIDFSPCDTCDRPCWRVCPQQAFVSGSYSKSMCNKQMKVDEANRVSIKNAESGDGSGAYIKYCRACELACPVAR
jgi:epoxyqueuosine reductase